MNNHAAKVERVARAICKQRGFNPDRLVMGGLHPPERGPNGTLYVDQYQRPAWQVFTVEAEVAIEELCR